MSKYNQYCIYNKYTRQIVFKGSYNICLEHFNIQDKTFRLQNKIIPYKND